MNVVIFLIVGITIAIVILILLLVILKTLKDLGGNRTNNIMKNNNALPAVPVTSTGSYELVAVITAAIAASLGTSPDKLIVRSFRQVNPNDKSAWRTAAKSDYQKSIN